MERFITKEKLECIFTRFYNNLLGDSFLSAFFESKDQIDALIQKQVSLFLESLKDDEKSFEERFFKLGEIHHKIDIPLFNIISGMNFLKNELFLELAHDGMLNENYQKMSIMFSKIQEHLSYAYFKKELIHVKNRHIDELNNTIFYRLHIKWIMDFLDYLENPKATKKPELSFEKNMFVKWLKSSYASLIIRDDWYRDEIISQFKYFHKVALSVQSHINYGRYYDALALLESLQNSSTQIMHLLDKKVLEHFNTKEEAFFQFIENEQKNLSQSGHLTIINIRKLALVNKYRGNNVADAVVEKIAAGIKSFIVGLDEDMMFIQSSNSDFYIFYSTMAIDEILKTQSFLKSFLEGLSVDVDEMRVTSKIALSTINLNGVENFKSANKLLQYSLAKAKEQDDGSYYLDKSEAIEALELIKKSQSNIYFVQHALLQKDLEIYFQPIFSIETGLVYDVEVLARIKRGNVMVAAGSFIDLIYELDIVIDLDIEVLSKVISHSFDVAKVTDKVFINVSPSSLVSPRYIKALDNFMERIKASKLTPIFELTEQSFLENLEIIKQIHTLHGVKFAVDDFGTGYSSLKTVAELAEEDVIDYIKIDGSIIKNIITSKKTFHILDATNYMTQKLDLISIAEFVENSEILELVKKLGINLAQGYHFEKAIPIDELVKKYGKTKN